MELVAPSATTQTTHQPADRPPDAPVREGVARPPGAHGAARAAWARRPSSAGAVLGGSSFETHLPGAWFFGMPGGPFGRSARALAADRSRRSPSSSAGLILLTRVWLGLLRYLRRQPGLPGQASRARRRRLGRPAAARAAALQSRRLHLCRAGRDDEPPHQSLLLRARACSGRHRSTRWRTPSWSETESPYGPTFLGVDGVLDQASGHQILPDLVLLRLLAVAGVALMVAATPTLARSLKRDPAHAVLLGAGSPLVLLSLVGRRPQRRVDGRAC